MTTQLPPSSEPVAAVRRFGRCYTQRLGFLGETLLSSGYTLPEARLIYELGTQQTRSAKQLASDLGLDPGYVSRLLGRLEAAGLIRRRVAPADGRQRVIELTAAGRRAYRVLDRRANEQVTRLLEQLPADRQRRLLGAMAAVESVLEGRPESGVPWVLRPHQLGDLGWVVSRHGVLYGQEYGWDETFEGQVAGIAGHFLEHYDPAFERSWIAEIDGQRVGSVFVTRPSAATAQLRMLLLEPQARGLGLGRRLVAECVEFARGRGYRDMVLETCSILIAARRIYQAAGFELVESHEKRTWGHDLVHERWHLELGARSVSMKWTATKRHGQPKKVLRSTFGG